MLHSWFGTLPRTSHIGRRQATVTRSRIAALVGFVLVAALALVAVPRSAGAADPVLLSQGKPAAASSTENAATPASAAFDGDPGTRWSSAFSDPQWVQVDLGTSQTISKVLLTWEAAHATAFQIQTSGDGTSWTPIYATTTGTGGTQTLNVSGAGRFVRMYGTARATQYGYSLYEFLVFGGGTRQLPCTTAGVGMNKPALASSTENAGTPASLAFDGYNNTRWSSAAADPQWLQVDLGSPQDICGVSLYWETAYATAYQVQISDNGTTWNTVYSTTAGAGGVETRNFTATTRYVRMYGTARATRWGYSLWEFRVLTGTPPPGGNTTPPPAAPTAADRGSAPTRTTTATPTR